ncbi:hypothetical protein IVA95_29860 [Bradyrhizobium sp. 157]|uniref:hypothetical protein n=1 Tax=Bradyrhizobium sp. 157 TaxID=2782631 RepID=UPI001FF7A9D2|nr:hypothetical protein [Bradyrhizobium sp. 157]MCK1641635.1 hypothetical protein [Bradyrhizobium sp. 157]
MYDIAAAVVDPDVRARAAADIEDVVTGVIAQRLGMLDCCGQIEGRENLRAQCKTRPLTTIVDKKPTTTSTVIVGDGKVFKTGTAAEAEMTGGGEKR